MLHSLDKLVDLVAARGADAVASGHEREREREREETRGDFVGDSVHNGCMCTSTPLSGKDLNNASRWQARAQLAQNTGLAQTRCDEQHSTVIY